MRKMLLGTLLVVFLCSSVFSQNTPCANMPAGRQGSEQMQGRQPDQMSPQQTPAGGMMMKGDMMQMCAPMMKHMMGQTIVTRDIMQLMKEIIQVEQKIVRGLNAKERKQVLAELDQKLEKLDRMMDDMRSGMMQGQQPSASPQSPGKGPGEPQQAPSGHVH